MPFFCRLESFSFHRFSPFVTLFVAMEINADIGEMTGADGEIMPHISVGNIACGYHASNPAHMVETVKLAISCGVKISAHPGYDDRENFGRVSVPHSGEEIVRLVEDQVGSLSEICAEQGTTLFAIKPHGALYHDMMQSGIVREAMVNVAEKYEVPLIVPFVPRGKGSVEWGVPVLEEVFADRAYGDDGLLVARSVPGSLYVDEAVILAQARELIRDSSADTLCFHGDNPASVAALKCLYAED